MAATLSLNCAYSQNMEFDWAKTYVETDGQNQIYNQFFQADSNHLFVAGTVLSHTNDFDPDSATTYMLQAPYDRSFHISKFDLDGNHVWSIVFGTTKAGSPSMRSEIKGMALDKKGNLYVTGTFLDTLYYETPNGLEYRTSKGYTDIFFGKIDTTGHWLWMKSYGGIYDDGAPGVTIAKNGEIYLSGYYADSVAFIPASAPNYAPFYELFVLKFNSLDQEQWLFSTNNPVTTPVFEVSSIVTDVNDGIYIGGNYFDYYSDSVNFQSAGKTELFASSSNNSRDGFLLKLDTAGNFKWAKSYATSGNDYVDDLSFNSANNALVISGRAGYDTLDFDPATTADSMNFPSYFSGNFLLTITPEGAYKWMKLLYAGSSAPINPKTVNITTDSKGNIHALATFDQTIDADPGSDTVIYETSPHAASFSSYSLKLDSLGNYLWSYQYKTKYNGDIAYGIGKDPFDNIYIGLFDGTGITPDSMAFGNIDLISPATARHFAKLRACGAELVTRINDSTLMANYKNCTYQWLDCNNNYATIPGATNRTFTTSISGNYALASTSYGCGTDTSESYLLNTESDITGNITSDGISVFPNPTIENVTVRLAETAQVVSCNVVNVLGQTIYHHNFENVSQFKIQFPHATGMYFIELRLDNSQRLIKKVIKE